MTRDDDSRRDEWTRLRAERAQARRELISVIGDIEARARDPFGLKEKIRRHPAIAAAVAAGAGAILVNLLLPRGSKSSKSRADDDDDRGDAGPSIVDSLRDAALRVAGPWIARFVEEHVGPHLDPRDPADEDASESNRAA